jgi:hypothetical protein
MSNFMNIIIRKLLQANAAFCSNKMYSQHMEKTKDALERIETDEDEVDFIL